MRVAFGSADLMERNLDRRVEVVVPIADPALQRRVAGLLDWAPSDQANSWELGPDGRWVRVAPDLPPRAASASACRLSSKCRPWLAAGLAWTRARR